MRGRKARLEDGRLVLLPLSRDLQSLSLFPTLTCSTHAVGTCLLVGVHAAWDQRGERTLSLSCEERANSRRLCERRWGLVGRQWHPVRTKTLAALADCWFTSYRWARTPSSLTRCERERESSGGIAGEIATRSSMPSIHEPQKLRMCASAGPDPCGALGCA